MVVGGGAKTPARVVRHRFSWEIEFRSRSGTLRPLPVPWRPSYDHLSCYIFGVEPIIFVANCSPSALLVQVLEQALVLVRVLLQIHVILLTGATTAFQAFRSRFGLMSRKSRAHKRPMPRPLQGRGLS
jgi:hypothetical protein